MLSFLHSLKLLKSEIKLGKLDTDFKHMRIGKRRVVIIHRYCLSICYVTLGWSCIFDNCLAKRIVLHAKRKFPIQILIESYHRWHNAIKHDWSISFCFALSICNILNLYLARFYLVYFGSWYFITFVWCQHARIQQHLLCFTSIFLCQQYDL